jgi:Domain of unknown function (DUF4382)
MTGDFMETVCDSGAKADAKVCEGKGGETGRSVNKKIIFRIAPIAVILIASGSGLKNKTCTDCTATPAVSISLDDTPPAGATVLSFSLPIAGISLTPSSGSPVSVYSPTSFSPVELTRLQTDSALIVAAAQVPSDTYTSIKVTIGASSGVFINANPNQSTITGSNVPCTFGKVCHLPTGAATTVNIPLRLSVTDVNQWIGLDVNLDNAIVNTNNTISVDFTQPNVFTATTTHAWVSLPEQSTPSKTSPAKSPV